jgi:hypothetical protein
MQDCGGKYETMEKNVRQWWSIRDRGEGFETAVEDIRQ